MAVTKIDKRVTPIELQSTTEQSVTTEHVWTRPADWLPLPTVSFNEEKFVGVYAIWSSGGNFVSLHARGAYTVDWGDGVVENFTDNTQCYHEYDYTNVNLAGTESARGYKQAIITVTPQVGQNLIALDIKRKHNQIGLANNYASGWLDITLSMPKCSALGLVISSTSTTLVEHAFLERVTILNFGNQTTCSSLFANCRALQSVPLFNTQNVTNMSSMFNACSSLQSVPLFNTQAVTSMISMFSGCSSLQSAPLFNTALVTSMGSMFSSCSSLRSVALFNTQAVSNMGSMFNGCSSLQSVPLFNTTSVTSMVSMFNGCSILQSVPALNATSVSSSANISNIFSSCRNLSKIPISNIKYTFSVASCKLSATALNEIYTNLPVVTGQTITVTDNYGIDSDDPTIATAKGWTVTG